MGRIFLFRRRSERVGSKVIRHQPGAHSIASRSTRWLGAVIIASNLCTFALSRPTSPVWEKEYVLAAAPEVETLYLLDKAEKYIEDTWGFADKVEEIAQSLEVPAEWLMAAMYTESKFNHKAVNHKGSGAVGLIQWMPATAKDLGTSSKELLAMTALEQLEYMHAYLQRVRKSHGDFHSLTEFYLAILYPKAISQDYCYTLFAKPTRAYRQNAGLDENKDGRITVSDIDKRMQRIFPTAYLAAVGVD